MDFCQYNRNNKKTEDEHLLWVDINNKPLLYSIDKKCDFGRVRVTAKEVDETDMAIIVISDATAPNTHCPPLPLSLPLELGSDSYRENFSRLAKGVLRDLLLTSDDALAYYAEKEYERRKKEQKIIGAMKVET